MEARTKLRALAATLVLSVAGIAHLVQDEANVPTVYLDPVGIPTVCVGHTATVTRKDIGKTFSSTECQELLRQDTRLAQAAIRQHVKVPVTQGQYDALVSFTFNVGVSNFKSSTLLRKINAGQCRAAGQEFARWNKAKGRVLRGLTLRRAREAARWTQDCQ